MSVYDVRVYLDLPIPIPIPSTLVRVLGQRKDNTAGPGKSQGIPFFFAITSTMLEICTSFLNWTFFLSFFLSPRQSATLYLLNHVVGHDCSLREHLLCLHVRQNLLCLRPLMIGWFSHSLVNSDLLVTNLVTTFFNTTFISSGQNAKYKLNTRSRLKHILLCPALPCSALPCLALPCSIV